MKKRFFYLPLLATLAMTACTNDDDLIIDEPATPDSVLGSGDYGYVAVNISQAGSTTGSRADAPETGFVHGVDAENIAQKGLFYVFKGPSLVGAAQELELAPTGATTPGSTNIERTYQAVLVIDGEQYDAIQPGELSIVCILNAPDETGTTSANPALAACKTLEQLKAKVADYCTNYQTSGKFIMTNSVYQSNGQDIIGTPVEVSKIKTSKNKAEGQEAAKADPVEIYVERVVSKVNLKKNAKFENTGATVGIDGVETPLTIQIDGIEIANIAEKANLFKDITGSGDWKKPGTDDVAFGTWWNDATNFRSYWENTSTTYANKSWNEVHNQTPNATSVVEGENGPLDVLGENGYNIYIQPNTNYNQKTAVLVAATLKKADGTAPDFVYLKGGYFTPDNAMAVIAKAVANSGYYMAPKEETTPTSYTQLSKDNFEWVNNNDDSTIKWIKRYEVVAKVTNATVNANNFYKREGNTYTQVGVSEINTFLQGTSEQQRSEYTARYYKEGKCYYFVNIDQTAVANEKVVDAANKYAAHTFDGVVRNHYYMLSLDGIGGLGTPVFDPDDIIIPEVPEDEDLSYLAATVKVLSWKFVNQGVTFGN